MIQTIQAKILWEAISQSVRLKLLNNVCCADCKKTTGVGNVKMTVENGDLIVIGICTKCGGKVARLVESAPEAQAKKIKPNGRQII